MIAGKNIRYLAIGVIITALVVLQVYFLNKYSTIGQQLSDLQMKIEAAENQNIRYRTEIASASAMLTISAQAQELGLINIPVTISFKSPLPVAYDLNRSL